LGDAERPCRPRGIERVESFGRALGLFLELLSAAADFASGSCFA
jgi:hypothetical protein